MSVGINEELRLAAEKGDLAKVREAIARGADRNAWPSGSDSALCYAVMFDHPDVVKLLVEAGADVRHAGSYGRRPLHHARRPAIATLLIDHGAELAVLDEGGDDALRHQVTRFDLDDVAAVLLDRGLPLLRYRSHRGRQVSRRDGRRSVHRRYRTNSGRRRSPRRSRPATLECEARSTCRTRAHRS
ncbi:MAG: ankyrin repeat domain-containing protein [Deltaproteobacteria bacterium]|nr:ankyrin repeat domain-containing protein [Deltaproteobacteria bacterium]